INDAAAGCTPVSLSRYDGHVAFANSAALRLAGVTAATPDPPGGTMLRDAKANQTGILKDAAMSAVAKIIPPLTHEQRVRDAQRALAHAASVGVTSFQYMD